MKPLNPVEETEAFVETVKLLLEFHGQPNLKEIAVFFPDAFLIKDEDYKSESFGEGLYLLMKTDPFRFALIVSLHVKNYKLLGFRLIAENSSHLGVLVGMFILSTTIKEEGRELFSQPPPASYTSTVIDKITKRAEEDVVGALKTAQALLPLKGVKEEYAFLSSPQFYWENYKRALKLEGKELTDDVVVPFLSHFVGILSAFSVVSAHI
ncbi:hypothetical protein [Thermovibrio sp.]